MLVLETPSGINFSLLEERRYTLEKFWALPEPDDGSRYELIGGYLFLVPRPGPPHGDVTSKMARAVILFLLAKEIAGSLYFPHEAICRCDEGSTYFEPDIMYVSDELRAKMGPLRTSADIVFESLSEDTAVYDRTTKADTYLALGVKELWLIDPVTLTIEVRHPARVDDTLIWEIFQYSQNEHAKSRVLDGWEVSVNEIFEDLL